MDTLLLITLLIGCSFLSVLFFILLAILILKKSKAFKSFIIKNSGLQEYLDSVGDFYSRLLTKKEEIKSVLKDSVGKSDDEVFAKIEETYENLDDIMKDYTKNYSYWNSLLSSNFDKKNSQKMLDEADKETGK